MIRTDLALEARESFPEDDVEVKGVILKEEEKNGIKITTLEIKDERAAKAMNKPVGMYITIEVIICFRFFLAIHLFILTMHL